MRFRAIVGPLLAAAALVVLAPTTAAADEPVDLAGAYVLDTTGVLGGDTDDVRAALDDLYERRGAQLFVVLVDTFTGAADDQAWADDTAEISGLGASDALLAIAVEDRAFRYSVGESFPLSDAQLDEIAEDRLIPALRDQRWAAGIQGLADGIGDRLSGGGIPIVPVLLGLAAGGAVIYFVVRAIRRRRGTGAGQPVTRLDQEQLDRRAGTLLVRLDDGLKTSDQELGFAVAQFGEPATTDFAAALAEAQKDVAEAFSIRQRLDDAEPETPDERRALTLRIIELCESAEGILDAQTAAFDQLRELEKNAPRVLESVSAEHRALPNRIATAEGTVADLRSRFGEARVAPVADNVAQARKLEAFTATALAQAGAELTGGDASGAAVAVRGAQQAVGQVEQLLAAIDRLAVDLPALVARLAAAVEDTRADVAEARGSTASDGLDAAIAEAERVLAVADGQDPATALAAVEKANAGLNEVLTRVRDRDAQVARATAQLGRMTDEARSTIAAAHDFITTRRGGIGSAARTRVAEAERQLTQALALGSSDPIAALAAAQQAETLGSAALDLARNDVASFENRPTGGGFDGAVLGGILGGLLSGGSGGGSDGGWSWGGSGGGWSGSRPGGFGGSRPRPSQPSRPSRPSRPARRGGGGRF
jgi:ABC-type transporter Mla subunit MlaD